MLQLKYPTDFFSSDCLTFSLSIPKKIKQNKSDTMIQKKEGEKKKKRLAIQWRIVLPAIAIPWQT